MSSAGASSATASINDLDGCNFRDPRFPSNASFTFAKDDDFGFDPPSKPNAVYNDYTFSSPPNDCPSQWPETKRENEPKKSTEIKINLDGFELDKSSTSTMPQTAVSRFGQVTPPRSASTASTASKEDNMFPKAQPLKSRKRGSLRNGYSETVPGAPAKKTERKRRSMKKLATLNKEDDTPEESKRKHSLEKNRIAAAKCRINKKEKTERLQRDSHDKRVENACLREQVTCMKDEIQQTYAILVAHANCAGCKSPEEIQTHLIALADAFFSEQIVMAGENFTVFPQMSFERLPATPDNFFSGSTTDHTLHPPLPEFNRSAEFEVHTPLRVD
ncbi:uncharacterized protein PV07_09438 [Cladophialophora immunda]|uniref:Basic leucine zipper transcriptional factor ATF-like n=1 Tax=Cladophialophora immunda TaxID=569365 RepID=A0A0D2C579_9EURO|nr:uncharacterized protein PV07_09438 [Cladophialophora immunda]KIW26338.1 hypothetical protein PV07_09438 [Cladophialophora immunda]OQV06011.1 hypothetical protein CLAIMM_10654 [Cladophialophora immunda]